MAIQEQPETQMQAEQTTINNQISLLGTISNDLQALYTAANSLQDVTGGLDARTVTSSQSSVVTATANSYGRDWKSHRHRQQSGEVRVVKLL